MNEEQYQEKVRNYRSGSSPLFAEGERVIIMDIPPSVGTVYGMYGCDDHSSVGKTKKVARRRSKCGGKMYTYQLHPGGWWYLECDLMPDYPQLPLFSREVLNECKSR